MFTVNGPSVGLSMFMSFSVQAVFGATFVQHYFTFWVLIIPLTLNKNMMELTLINFDQH